MPQYRMGTAASEPRCRCVYLHRGLDPPLGPPHGRTWQRSGHWKRAPPRVVTLFVVQLPQGAVASMAVVPRGQKGGRDRSVLARLILLLRSLVSWRGIVWLPVAARRDQRNTRAVRDGRNEGRSLPSALIGLPRWIARRCVLPASSRCSAPEKEVFGATFCS